jgi:glycosyltransferase involved in cell wall biosynthesis
MVELVITEKNPTKKTICLNMIVKNESKIIRETLQKLCAKINFDFWVISDTGSTDNTIEVIETFFKEMNIPGEIFQHEWKDFGYNRTQALMSAYEKTDYVLIFDADDEIVGDFKLPDVLEHDEYLFQFGNHIDKNIYGRVLMVNNRKKWLYVGVLHEVIVPYEHQPSRYIISGDYYTVSGRCGDRNTNNPDKYLKDAKILEKAYYECIEKKDTLYNRYAFYCANSYKDHGDFENAIIWYKKRMEYSGWIEEIYISYLEAGTAMIHLGYKAEEIISTFMNGFRVLPNRAECLFFISQYCFENKRMIEAYNVITLAYKIPFPNQYILFLKKDIYDFRVKQLRYFIMIFIRDYKQKKLPTTFYQIKII